MVTATSCPICRKAVFHDEPGTIVARMRGMPDTFPLIYFHAHCYPGDEGSGFDKVDDEDQ